MQYTISRYQRGIAESLRCMSDRAIQAFACELFDCYLRRGTVFIVGNGGSAATASHFACDLMKGTRCGPRPTFRVICPTDSIPGMTAWSNDVDYSQALAEHVAAFISSDDILVAISTSGNSRNVLEAVHAAKRAGARTLAMTGSLGGQLASIVDLALFAPSDVIEQVEDLHLIVAHCVCVTLREEIRALDTAPEPAFEARTRSASEDRLLESVSATES